MCNVSRPTLQKALKSGKVSGVQDGKGHWQVDPSELSRVYQARGANAAKVDKAMPGNLFKQNRGLPGKDDVELSVLRAELEQERIRRGAAEVLAEERGRTLPPPESFQASGKRPRRWWQW